MLAYHLHLVEILNNVSDSFLAIAGTSSFVTPGYPFKLATSPYASTHILEQTTLCPSVSHQRPARVESQRETESVSGSNKILHHACVNMFCNVGIFVWRK